jgi:hypothetical protein
MADPAATPIASIPKESLTESLKESLTESSTQRVAHGRARNLFDAFIIIRYRDAFHVSRKR